MVSKIVRPTTVKCEHCGKVIGDFSIKTFSTCLKEYNKTGKRNPFCSQECIDDYKSQFKVEEYNGQTIYYIEKDGKIFYLPYWQSSYGFENIEDCRKRIDSVVSGCLIGLY